MKKREVAYIGIDVSKETLDIDAGEFGGAMKIKNTLADIRKALKAIAGKAKKTPHVCLHVCFESTGRYGDELALACRASGTAYSVLNPYKVACFAKAIAHAKTDALDAALIRSYAQVRKPEPAPPPSKGVAELDKLLLLRDALVNATVLLRAVLSSVPRAAVDKPVRAAIAFNNKQIKEYDRLIAETVKADAELSGLSDALCAVKGIGTLTAAKLAAWLPEIGTLGRRRAAALVGLAPRTRESGKWKGLSKIGGGRKAVRDALFMPATSARRHDPHMKAAYDKLIAKGKLQKVAQAAAMRMLICHLESVAKNYREKRARKPPPPASLPPTDSLFSPCTPSTPLLTTGGESK